MASGEIIPIINGIQHFSWVFIIIIDFFSFLFHIVFLYVKLEQGQQLREKLHFCPQT